MKEGFKVFGWTALAMLVLSIALLAIKLVLFPVNVAHKAVNSAAGVANKTLDSNNVIANYEWFYDTSAQFGARVGQIRAHMELVNDESDAKERSRLSIELSAMRQSCRDMASKYNANSEKMNRSLFKAKSLPETLSLNQCEV